MRFGLFTGMGEKISAVALLLAALSTGLASAATLSNVPTTSTWVTNGQIYAITRTTDTVYLGGYFSFVGPFTGGFVPISATTGKAIGTFPKVQGTVRACVSDGDGGWYIGGDFSRVGALPRNNIAHILADGHVDSAWNPGSGTIYALTLSGDTLYVGGCFPSIGGQVRNNIAALDASSGVVKAWNPNADHSVYALAVAGGTVYAGGIFTSIGGQDRHGLVALDVSNGTAKDWNLNTYREVGGFSEVDALTVSGGTVYVGGSFDNIGGQYRHNLAALDSVTGSILPWEPNPNGEVQALAFSGGLIYAGGRFTNIGGQTRNYLAAVDSSSTCTVTNWNPNANSDVYALMASGGTLYVGGYFTSISGQLRNHLAALNITSGTAMDWNPNASNEVLSLAVAGGTVYAGGAFNSIGGQIRNNIAALNASSGTVTDWNPNANWIVEAIAVAGGTVYAGGWFSSIGGQARNCLAALDAASGTVTANNYNISGTDTVYVSSLVASGGRVYVGGAFNRIGGQTRNNLAALDSFSGDVTSWNPNANGKVRALTASGGKIYAGGDFWYVAGQYSYRLAALDAVSGGVTRRYNFNGNVRTLAVSSGTLCAGGQFTSVAGQTCTNLVALDTNGSILNTWNRNTNDTVSDLAASGRTVYAGGWFTYIGGWMRNYLAALDSISGTATAWNPNPDHAVFTLAAWGGTIYVGGAFTTIGGQPQSYFAQFDPTMPPVAPINLGAPGIKTDRLTWAWTDASDNEAIFKVWADPGMGTPSTLRATFLSDNSWLYSGLTPNTQYAFQVQASNAAGDSARTNVFTTFTLAAPPTIGQNAASVATPGTAWVLGKVIAFSNPAGFGAGTHGGGAWAASGFRWVWDTNPTHSFSGVEALWNAGLLNCKPVKAGSYYLHLQSLNGAGVATPQTLDLGPFNVTASSGMRDWEAYR